MDDGLSAASPLPSVAGIGVTTDKRNATAECGASKLRRVPFVLTESPFSRERPVYSDSRATATPGGCGKRAKK
jgi:hypothetical protein